MKKVSVSILMFLTLVGCGVADEESDKPSENEENITTQAEDSNVYQEFYLTQMEKSRFEEQIDYSYGFNLPANSVVVKSSSSMVGLDGNEIVPEPQPLIDFERKDDGTITFSFEGEVFTETASSIELKTITLYRLSKSIYELEDGTRYEFSEEEK